MPGVHADDEAAQRPENAVFDAADHPDPTVLHLPGGSGRDQKVNEADEASVSGKDAEDQADRQCCLDRPGDVHPGRRRFETGSNEEFERRRHRYLPDDVRNEEGAANDAQNVEFIEQIEIRGHD